MTPKRIAELQDYVRNEPRAMQPAAFDLLTIERAELADLLNAAAREQRLREALEELHKWNHGLAYVGVPDSWKLASATLADTAAGGQAHDERVRQQEREELYAHFTEVAIDAVRRAAAIRARAKEGQYER